MRQLLLLAASLVVSVAPALAQDPVKVDAKHYKVELENDQVRVIRATFGPKEKSVMHEHPAHLAVFLNDIHAKFTFPDGKSEEAKAKAGQTQWEPAGKHLPENLGSTPFEVIVIELKGKSGAAAPAKPSK